MTDTKQDPRALKRHITQALEAPRLAFENGWYRDSAFCEGFFDRCEHRAMVLADDSLELAHRGVQIAETNGDPHLVHQSYGVLSHAYLSRADRFWAGKTLDQLRDAALACCPLCRSRYLRREGDLLGEERNPFASLTALGQSLEEGAEHLDPDAFGRTYFCRGISQHFAGYRGRALADAGEALRLLSLESPQGFFLDAIACMTIFVGGGDESHEALALELLKEFERRIKGLDGWTAVRTRNDWSMGHLYAGLGDARRALSHLEKAHRKLLDDGLAREALASALDLCQFRCRARYLRDDNERAADRVITKCLDRRKDLPADQVQDLKKVRHVLRKFPENVFAELGELRRSFVAPVPGHLGGRVGPRS